MLIETPDSPPGRDNADRSGQVERAAAGGVGNGERVLRVELAMARLELSDLLSVFINVLTHNSTYVDVNYSPWRFG